VSSASIRNLICNSSYVCTYRWMRKDLVVCCHCTIEHSHVIYKIRPSSKYTCKNHIKVTRSHHILGCHVLATQVLNKLVIGHDHRNVSAIYCPYTILKEGLEPTVP
jgi:hypothetical protein